jgi:hypothetical protein
MDLLDLGGGHGLYSVAFCMRYRHLHARVLDLATTIGELETNRASDWSLDGKYLYIFGGAKSYLFEVKKETGLPELPKEGFGTEEELRKAKAYELPPEVDSLIGLGNYAYTRNNVRRNIYRVPIG